MRETLVTCVSYQDGDYLWCFDEIICALSRINLVTLQVECVISPMQIFAEGEFKVRKLIGWKDKIIILPVRINKKWIIYNKQKNEIEYMNFCLEDFESSETFLIENKLYFLPICVEKPIIIIDLTKKEVIRRISLQHIEFHTNEKMKIWDGKLNQGDICFLIRESCFYGRLNERSFHLIKLNVSKPLACADFYEGFIWAVDNDGKKIYKFDKKGNLIKDILLDAETKFTRILVEKECIFLLPEYGYEILKFDTENEEEEKIGKGSEMKFLDFPEMLEMIELPVYWDYIKKDLEIWFLPFKGQLKKFNMNKLICDKRTIEYSDIFSSITYKKYLDYVRKIKNKLIIYENSTKLNCKKYLELLKYGKRLEKGILKKSYADIIWKTLL